MNIGEAIGDELRVVVTIDPEETILHVVDLLKENSIGAVVVTADQKKILGIISERDVVRHLTVEQEGTLRLRVEDLMTSKVSTCGRDDDIEAVMAVMTKGHFRHMPVVNESNELLAIVSLGDLVQARLDELEAQYEALRSSGG